MPKVLPSEVGWFGETTSSLPSARIKLGAWEIDASDGHLRFRKDGDGQMFVMHNKSWHDGSTWVKGNYYSERWNKWL